MAGDSWCGGGSFVGYLQGASGRSNWCNGSGAQGVPRGPRSSEWCGSFMNFPLYTYRWLVFLIPWKIISYRVLQQNSQPPLSSLTHVMTPCPPNQCWHGPYDNTQTKMAVFLKAYTDPKTINIDIRGTGVMCLKVKTYDEVAIFFEEPGITDVTSSDHRYLHAWLFHGGLCLRRSESQWRRLWQAALCRSTRGKWTEKPLEVCHGLWTQNSLIEFSEKKAPPVKRRNCFSMLQQLLLELFLCAMILAVLNNTRMFAVEKLWSLDCKNEWFRSTSRACIWHVLKNVCLDVLAQEASKLLAKNSGIFFLTHWGDFNSWEVAQQVRTAIQAEMLSSWCFSEISNIYCI